MSTASRPGDGAAARRPLRFEASAAAIGTPAPPIPNAQPAGASGDVAERGRDVGRPDWLANLLTVSGPAGEVARFRAAACGTNAAPWQLDLDAEEARLFAPMAGGGAEARMLARQLREVIAARHERVLARWHEVGRCPLDLHRLIPIPDRVLRLGEDDPAAQDWLRAHWGTTFPLRHARVLDDAPDRRLRRSARVLYAFYSADWTPWQAVLRLRRDWPRLVLAVEPRYDDG